MALTIGVWVRYRSGTLAMSRQGYLGVADPDGIADEDLAEAAFVAQVGQALDDRIHERYRVER
jgi:hypothetical protein